MELVSVVIPCYNMENLVEKCIRSVLNQTYKNVEIVAVDDGSTDNTGKILDKIAETDPRLKVIHQANGGVGSATNRALDNVTGDYVTPLDCDDYFAPEMVERLLNAIHEYNADIVQCDRYRFYSISGLEFSPQNDTVLEFSRNEILNEYFHEGITNLNWGSKLYKREIINGIRCPEGHQFVDVIIAPQFLNRCKKYVYLTGKYYYNYLAPNSISRKEFTDNRWNDYEYINSFYDNFIKTQCPDHIDYLSYRYVNGALNTYIAIHRSNKVSEKRKKLEKLSNEFNRHFVEFKNTTYYSQCTFLRKMQIRLFRISPRLFALVFGDISSFFKYKIIVPVKKVFQQ